MNRRTFFVSLLILWVFFSPTVFVNVIAFPSTVPLTALPSRSARLVDLAETSVVPQHAIGNRDPPSDDWPTYHRDTFRSGYDPAIPQFTSVSLNWKSTTLDGDVYAEPLIVGTEVIVATESNSLYELNATNGQTIWHINLGTPVNGGVLPCGDINPSGITGTPVIDVAGRTIFVVAFLQSPQLHHELFAVNLDNGNVEFQLAIDPSGANPLYQQQRAALAMSNGYVYVAYGGLAGDCGTYHGWLAATNTNGGGPVISYQVPTGRAGAIWGGGDGPVVDNSGDLLVATGNSFSTSVFDSGNAVMKLSPASSGAIGLIDSFAPSNWVQLNEADLDLGSTEPVILSSNFLFQIGKDGIGYLLNATKLGGIGGQLYSSQVCTSGHGAYGGLAYSSPYLVVPCDNGVVALKVNLGSNLPFTVIWRGPNFVAGPPIIAGNAVWDVDVGDGLIYALSPSSGQTLFHDTIGSVPTHFNSLSAGDGQIFVSASRQVLAYLPQVAIIFYTTPSTFLGASSPGSISACGGTFTNGQSSTGCGSIFSATANLPSPSTGWQFSNWIWTGGVSCTSSSANPTSCTVAGSGSLQAVFIFTRPSTVTSLTLTPNSVTIGSSLTLSGSVSPNPGAVVVTISYSVDSGSTWIVLMLLLTDNTGIYSTGWTPPYPGNYLLEASWSGNNQLAGSTSPSASLTVTGVITPTPTLLLTSPATVTRSQSVRLQITVFNPTSMSLTANVTIQIIGPGNYVTFYMIQVKVTANSESTGYYDWTAPNQSGIYAVTVGLLPTEPSAFDSSTIQVA